MKKILLPLLLSISTLFGNTIVGKWTINEKNTKASLATSSLQGNELLFIERFLLHRMKSLQCSLEHTCLIPELYNSNPHTGKYKWNQRGEEYLLEGNHKQFNIIPINATTIKMIVSDISEKKLEVYYTKNSSPTAQITQKIVPKITPLKTIDVTKKVIDTITTSIKSSTVTRKVSTHDVHIIPKQKLPIEHEYIVNIDIKAEKEAKRRRLEQEYLQATMAVM